MSRLNYNPGPKLANRPTLSPSSVIQFRNHETGLPTMGVTGRRILGANVSSVLNFPELCVKSARDEADDAKPFRGLWYVAKPRMGAPGTSLLVNCSRLHGGIIDAVNRCQIGKAALSRTITLVFASSIQQ